MLDSIIMKDEWRGKEGPRHGKVWTDGRRETLGDEGREGKPAHGTEGKLQGTNCE